MNKIEQMKLDLLRSKDSLSLAKTNIDHKVGNMNNPYYNSSYHGTHGMMYKKHQAQLSDQSGSLSDTIKPIKIVILTGSLKGSYNFKDQSSLNKFISESKALISRYKVYINGIYIP